MQAGFYFKLMHAFEGPLPSKIRETALPYCTGKLFVHVDQYSGGDIRSYLVVLCFYIVGRAKLDKLCLSMGRALRLQGLYVVVHFAHLINDTHAFLHFTAHGIAFP